MLLSGNIDELNQNSGSSFHLHDPLENDLGREGPRTLGHLFSVGTGGGLRGGLLFTELFLVGVPGLLSCRQRCDHGSHVAHHVHAEDSI